MSLLRPCTSFAKWIWSILTPTPFSYQTDPWIPDKDEKDVRIRLIELYPPPFPLSWLLPQSLQKLLPLHARISWAPLSSPGPFKALSYTWGSAPHTHQTISLSGQSLQITTSLATALQHLRDPHNPITLWIDQISIDQTNDAEKSEQVSNMGRIYYAATEVLVWLGPSAQDSDSAMDVYQHVGSWADNWGMLDYYTKADFPKFLQIVQKTDPTEAKTREFHAFCTRSLPLFTPRVLRAMVAWQQRAWFQRVWVVQEFSLAATATFVCGRKRVKAERVFLAKQIFELVCGRALIKAGDAEMNGLLRALLDDPSAPFFISRRRRKAFGGDVKAGESMFRLLQMMYVANSLKTSQACDTIYGLLGVVNDADKLHLRADYSMKERLDVLYARVARGIIISGNPDILALSQHPKTDDKFPSWVPDWRAKILRSFAWQSNEDRSTLFYPSGKSIAEVIAHEDELVLGLSGFYVDEIEDVGGPLEMDDGTNKPAQPTNQFNYLRLLNCLYQVKLMCELSAKKNNPIYQTPERRAEAVWRVPVGDIEPDEGEAAIRATQSFLETYKLNLGHLEFLEQQKVMKLEDSKKGLRDVKERGHESARYRSRMAEMGNKRPFITALGYVGMGPSVAQPGDIVVVFMGARLPYLLRPVKDRNFRFLGECYCDGIMDGEALNQKSKETFFLI